jgi:hypothetical protein
MAWVELIAMAAIIQATQSQGSLNSNPFMNEEAQGSCNILGHKNLYLKILTL